MLNDRWGEVPFIITTPEGRPFTIHPAGRVRWALEALIATSPAGCTPITTHGPRWACYINKLVRQDGEPIETAHEAHCGPLPGRDACYALGWEVRRAKGLDHASAAGEPMGGDPHAWLVDTLARTPNYKITQVDELLPWRWTR